MRRRSGSVFISDLVMSLLIAVMLVPALMLSIAAMHDSLRFNEEVQDQTALAQMRQILMISYDISTDGNVLYFEYQNRQCRLLQVNDHLIIQPGTQIILADIDTCCFTMAGQAVILQYERDGKTYHAALAAV